MDFLVRLFVVLRRYARPAVGYLFGGAWIALLVGGLFAPGGAASEIQLAAATVWAALLVARLVTRIGARARAAWEPPAGRPGKPQPPAGDFELGTLLLGGA